jgi:hypothetical protein
MSVRPPPPPSNILTPPSSSSSSQQQQQQQQQPSPSSPLGPRTITPQLIEYINRASKDNGDTLDFSRLQLEDVGEDALEALAKGRNGHKGVKRYVPSSWRIDRVVDQAEGTPVRNLLRPGSSSCPLSMEGLCLPSRVEHQGTQKADYLFRLLSQTRPLTQRSHQPILLLPSPYSAPLSQPQRQRSARMASSRTFNASPLASTQA